MDTAIAKIDDVLAFLDEELRQSSQSLSKARDHLEKLVVSKQCLMSATIFLSHQHEEIATTRTVLQDLREKTVETDRAWIESASQWNDNLWCIEIECIYRLLNLFSSMVSDMMYEQALPQELNHPALKSEPFYRRAWDRITKTKRLDHSGRIGTKVNVLFIRRSAYRAIEILSKIQNHID